MLAASEVVGFAKTGGLADVAGALPAALARRGIDCAVILPLFRAVRFSEHKIEPTGINLRIPIGTRTVEGSLKRTVLPGSSVPVFLVDQPHYFDRDDPYQGRGLYSFTENGRTRDYPDNPERFIFFAGPSSKRCACSISGPTSCTSTTGRPAWSPSTCARCISARIDPGLAAKYQKIRTLFTIHNIAYQGNFWHSDMLLAGLDWRLFNPRQLEFYGHFNFLKAGIVFADLLTTVSPTYAREIQTSVYGCGLQGVLAERRSQLSGIVNGVDYSVWDPRNDPHLPARYARDRRTGKPACKAALQERYGLPEQPTRRCSASSPGWSSRRASI